MNTEWITSAGIDVGTSTTKVILSRLKVSEQGNSFSVSHFEIVERELIYESPVYFTPLLSENMIDHPALAALLEKSLFEAGVDREEIRSGAVIITGETANKSNAEQIVHMLAEQAGDFVVAAAGAALEGILAGKGAGADRRSKEAAHTVANIDIGGGTANAALFQGGAPVATVTFHVGGRLIRLSPDGTVLYVSPALQRWLVKKDWKLEEGMTADYSLLEAVTAGMSRAMIRYLAGTDNGEAEWLSLGPLPSKLPIIGEITVSGGVAALMKERRPLTLGETATYGDVGPLLAHAVSDECRAYPWIVADAEQTVRATVIGAGMQSTELSGSTIHADDETLPVRNVPMLKLHLQAEEEWDANLDDLFERGRGLYSLEERAPFGLAFTTEASFTYKQLRRLADSVEKRIGTVFSHRHVAVIACDRDMAKALGQLLSLKCRGKPRVVCIDDVRLDYGDYIDIGEMIAGRAVPVMVKTLLFSGSQTGVES
ncbi:ethanolamine ammonia-lyase reactivating factor EutA [Paenibacillus sp. sptzw28]|uniref:ethanolamine ammonia-lyase reactivating factor EutA n=1 Tax=Paenibacillus sp. sptzw28 TaxID=715179 RepID=UPI001C6EBB81|nr:ethanolamine ammonia-lyase reactivating factor EutA [Paenibacillus sp. sptzw28]QYR20641.1 ethanolamine ammonia-lyase reactivating factor EutA [Paenibacillus sp. sptzw28]